MLRIGENEVDGVRVEVARKRIRRVNLRVKPDGSVALSLPKWWCTLREAEAFLAAKWQWALKVRRELAARPARNATPVTDDERRRLETTLGELNAAWTARLGEADVKWKLRRMKSLWGSCNWRKRVVTYNLELARVPRELAEYVVVHELAHLRAHDHGPRFRALMDERLPGWRELRRRLNKGER